MSNNIIDVNSIGEVDQLNGREKIIQCVTSLRLHPYNPGVPCGPKAIQIKLREEEISPVPSISTIASDGTRTRRDTLRKLRKK